MTCFVVCGLYMGQGECRVMDHQTDNDDYNNGCAINPRQATHSMAIIHVTTGSDLVGETVEHHLLVITTIWAA